MESHGDADRDHDGRGASGTAPRAVVDVSADGRWRTRPELVRRTGLSARTVDRVVARLLTQGILEAGRPTPGLGRPARPVRLRPVQRFVGAVILLRDEIASAVVGSDGSLHGVVRDRTTHWRDIDDLAAVCRGMLQRSMVQLSSPVDLDSVVLGFPLSYRQGVGHVPLQRGRVHPQRWMRGDLAADLSTALGTRVDVENTCRLATLAEHRFGAARGHDDAVYLQLVGGSNAGVIAGGRLIRGAGGFAGEISHLHVDPHGPPCPCGARGCLGVCIQNSDRLIATWRHLLPEVTDVYEVLGLAVQGDPRLRHLLGELGRFVGEHLAAGCIMLNPEVLVLDGSLGLAAGPFLAGVSDALRERLPGEVFDGLSVVPGTWGSEAALVGAAAFERVVPRPLG